LELESCANCWGGRDPGSPRAHRTELQPGTNRTALEDAFARICEANEWLRMGRELGSAPADPELDGAAGSARSGPEAKEFRRRIAAETARWLKVRPRRSREIPPAVAQSGAGRFSRTANSDQAMRPAEWRNQRRRFVDVAANPVSILQTGDDCENVEADFTFAAGGMKRRRCDPAK
jgi:hypothetical protein